MNTQEALVKVLLESWVKKKVQRNRWKRNCQGEGLEVFWAKGVGESNGSSVLNRLRLKTFHVQSSRWYKSSEGFVVMRIFWRVCSGAFLVQRIQIPFKWQLGDRYNYYSACSRPPPKLSCKTGKMIKSSHEISVQYFHSKCMVFMRRNRNNFCCKM